MIAAADSGPRYMGRATMASVALHLLLALLVPVLAWTATSAPDVYTVSFTSITHITIALPRAARPVARPIPRVTPPPTSARVQPAPRPMPHAVIAPPRLPSAIVRAAPPVPRVVATASAAPLASTTPQVRMVASEQHADTGLMPFGALQPDPVLDPNVLSQLRSLRVHVTLTVTVGDDGRTQHVSFAPPLDDATEAQIQALLASASWDPAYCGGGLPCAGQAVITL